MGLLRMKYTYYIDCGELLTESKEFADNPYITVVDGNGNKIGEFEV